MDVKELRTKTDAELKRELAEKRELARRTRFDLAAGRVKNIRTLRDTRRTIAQMLTILAEREKSA